MATFSNNTKPTNVLAANQKRNSSFGKKGSPALPLDSAKFSEPAEDDDGHIIRKCDTFVGGKL